MKKTFEEWEKSKGFFARNPGDFSSSKTITEEEFDDLLRTNRDGFVAVFYKERIEFLNKNGYEVNRENLINSDLSAKPVEQ